MEKLSTFNFIICLFQLAICLFSTSAFSVTMAGRTLPPTCKSNTSSSYKISSEVTCASSPSYNCPYGVRTAPQCLSGDGWCNDSYQPVPASAENFPHPNAPGIYTFAILKYGMANASAHVITEFNDPDTRSCPKPDGSGNITVTGGTTVCDVGNITGVNGQEATDNVLTYLDTFSKPMLASCSYFKPTCDTCCTSWSAAVCEDPPPPPPASNPPKI